MVVLPAYRRICLRIKLLPRRDEQLNEECGAYPEIEGLPALPRIEARVKRFPGKKAARLVLPLIQRSFGDVGGVDFKK